jgi:hypothetical protein
MTLPAAGLRRWAGIFTAYFTTQGIAQLAGIAAGLVFVNLMPVREFALYTLALSLASFLTLASDLGGTSSLLYFFHRSSGTGEAYEPYKAAVMSLRRELCVACGPILLAVLLATGTARGFGRSEILLAGGAALAGLWFQIGVSVQTVDLRLRGRFGKAYAADLVAALSRLALAGVLVATHQLAGWAGVLCNAAASAFGGIAATRGEPREPAFVGSLAPYRRGILRYLAPTLPSALYYAVQAPLVVWLAATFGSARTIAEVGALGRLGLVAGMFSGLIGIVFLPRLAATSDPHAYRRRYLAYGGVILGLAAGLCGAALVAPGALLFVLGKHYAGLDVEVLLVVGTAAINLIGAYLVGVNNARAWTRYQGLATAVLVAAQAALVAGLPLGTARGVLTFNLLSALVATGTQVPVALLGFSRPALVEWR